MEREEEEKEEDDWEFLGGFSGEDATTMPFTVPMPVISFITNFLKIDCRIDPMSHQNRTKVEKALNGMLVQVSLDGGKRRTHKVCGVTSETINELKLNTGEILVKEHFKDKYNHILTYGHLPGLQVGNLKKQPTYLPMEVCDIIGGERYKGVLNENQRSAIRDASRKSPKVRLEAIEKMGNFVNDNLVEDFQIRVDVTPAQVMARVLPRPMPSFEGGGVVKHWSILNFSSLSDEVIQEFSKSLKNSLRKYDTGLNSEPLIDTVEAGERSIEEALRDCHKSCVEELDKLQQDKLFLLLIILPDAAVRSYGKIKYVCEIELGIISQCIRPVTVKRLKDFTGLTMKINAKIGGVGNYVAMLPEVSEKSTIIFGADVTHPTSARDHESDPSVAAVVASMSWPSMTKYKCVLSPQTPRQEIIDGHCGIMRELLNSWSEANGQSMPERIIFYRDGVGESQFNEVIEKEINEIREACTSIRIDYRPSITFVVVQKRHHTRLFRKLVNKQGERTIENIEQGTVVDRVICHPNQFDFYLKSNSTLKGTSKLTHYHVLCDENNFSADDLQKLTFDLCCMHARGCRPLPIVSATQYAHLAAYRSRFYIEHVRASAGGRRSMIDLPSVKENIKDLMFYC